MSGSNVSIERSRGCGSSAKRALVTLLFPEFPLSSNSANKATFTPRELELGLDFGVAQSLWGTAQFPADAEDAKALIEKTRHYLQTLVMKQEIKDMCRNQHEQCTAWAVGGECKHNPAYMKQNCAPACLSCDYLTIEGRCPMDPNAPNAWKAGDLNAMFTQLTSEPYKTKYSVEILSSPATDGPWVITMENVLSEAEAEMMIQLGK